METEAALVPRWSRMFPSCAPKASIVGHGCDRGNATLRQSDDEDWRSLRRMGNRRPGAWFILALARQCHGIHDIQFATIKRSPSPSFSTPLLDFCCRTFGYCYVLLFHITHVHLAFISFNYLAALGICVSRHPLFHCVLSPSSPKSPTHHEDPSTGDAVMETPKKKASATTYRDAGCTG